MAPQSSFEIVIAHYNENLEWLNGLESVCTIYSKGGAANALQKGYQKLPNIGREGHTYLHHIVERYDTLPEVTIFLQGRIDDHVSISLDEVVELSLATQNGQVTTFPYRELELFDAWDGVPWNDYPIWQKWNSMERLDTSKTPGQYWQQLFPGTKVPLSVGFQPAALFALRKSTIQQHPHAFYKSLLEEWFLGPMMHINPETGHFLERLWLAIFNPAEYVCWDKADVAKEERNKQGQLARGKWHRTPKHVKVDPYILHPTNQQ